MLNAGDTVLAVNGVARGTELANKSDKSDEHKRWVDAANAAGSGGNGSITFLTDMPYFQPNSLVTIGPLPSKSMLSVPLAPSSPPTIAAVPDSLAGVQPGDTIIQAIVDGRPICTTDMSSAELQQHVGRGESVVLTVLQGSRVMDGPAYLLPW